MFLEDSVCRLVVACIVPSDKSVVIFIFFSSLCKTHLFCCWAFYFKDFLFIAGFTQFGDNVHLCFSSLEFVISLWVHGFHQVRGTFGLYFGKYVSHTRPPLFWGGAQQVP